MNSVTVLYKQSLADISLQVYGNLTGLFLLAKYNGLAITDDVVAGTDLVVPKINTADTNVVLFYDKKSLKPATSVSEETLNPPDQLQGIGAMIIENDFIVQ